MKYLFLDDERMPSDVTWVVLPQDVEWAIVRTFHEMQAWIRENGIPNFVSFDNDLGGAPGNRGLEGWQCVELLMEAWYNGEDFPEDFGYAVHSKNSVAAENIKGKIEGILKYVQSAKETVDALGNR